MPATPIERIAVLLDSGVGDTLMATPMLRELRRQLPRATIVAVVNRGTAQVLVRNPDVDRLCVFRDSGDSTRLQWPALRMLRAFRPQAMLVPQTGNILIQIFAAYYPGAPVRVKHRFDYPPQRKYSDFEFLFTHSPTVSGDQHRVWDNLALLAALGLRSASADMGLVFPISGRDAANARALLESKGWNATRHSLCVHPGVGTATLNKQWAQERFAELARRLVAEHKLQVVLVGGRAEAELCRTLAAFVGSSCCVVAGECSLAETAAVIDLCDLFVSNDSGLMHVAASVGARGIALYGKTNPVKIGPLGGAIQVVQASSMDALTVDQVSNRCRELLPAPLAEERR